MPTRVQCPAPDCRAVSTSHDAASGRPVTCPKCGRMFVAPPTLDGRSKDTRAQPAGSVQNPFPTLPAEFGRYRVLELIGRGGMGAVYRALDTRSGQEVALKIPFFDPAVASRRGERFVRETKSAAALDHPNICRSLDAGQIDGRAFIAMELIVGRSLQAEIDPDQPMPQVRAARIAHALALALAHAHKRKVVHRDLKPVNVMLTADDEPVVMDFGLAKLTDESVADPGLTRTGVLLGTPAYMPPEQVRGAANVGPAADIYALGVVLFEMLTGRTPYSGGLTMIVGQVLTAPVPSVNQYRPDVDPRLEAICWRAMSKEAGKRFPSMAVMGMALAAYLANPTPTPDAAKSAAATRTSPVKVKGEEADEQEGESRRTNRIPLWVGLGVGALVFAFLCTAMSVWHQSCAGLVFSGLAGSIGMVILLLRATRARDDVDEESRRANRVGLWFSLAFAAFTLFGGVWLADIVGGGRMTGEVVKAIAGQPTTPPVTFPASYTPPDASSPPVPPPTPVGELFRVSTVWAGSTAGSRVRLTVKERKGERFVARLVIGTTIDREVNGVVKDDGTVSWIAAEVTDHKGGRGEDTSGSIDRDGGVPVLRLISETDSLELRLVGE